jgi:secernin
VSHPTKLVQAGTWYKYQVLVPGTRASDRGARVSCDSMVALGSRTATGRTIFAKNSDRPAAECQPLVQMPARDWAEGSRIQCQYVEIDQVPHTFGFVGARPAWLWGLEHGVNERGVAIGNHTIFTRDAVADRGLLGMDLVRLGLERGATAAAAVEVLIDLIERHGQGGSGYSDTHWPYHNSFLVADAREAWLLEASASRWALRRASDGTLSASNHTTIGTDWDRLGHDTMEHAIAMDWWPEATGVRFDFARAYRSTETVPPVISEGRYATTCDALAGNPLDVSGVQRVMRDHYDGGDVHVPGATPDDPRYFSVCMHADPVGTTTASMVIELHGDAGRPLVAWMALTNPCVSPYLPVFVDAPVPRELMLDADGGAWPRFKVLLGEVERDFASRAPVVREFWKSHEDAIVRETAAFLESLPEGAEARVAAERDFVEKTWRRASDALDEITRRVRAL